MPFVGSDIKVFAFIIISAIQCCSQPIPNFFDLRGESYCTEEKVTGTAQQSCRDGGAINTALKCLKFYN